MDMLVGVQVRGVASDEVAECGELAGCFLGDGHMVFCGNDQI
jgi:hypothetical protein